MSTPFHTNHRNLLLIILWGLLFTKCFALEYFVRAYAVPVNSALYVWALSISMAAAATFVFVRLKTSQQRAPASLQRSTLIWAGCALGIATVLAAGFYWHSIAAYQIPAWLAVCIGLGYALQGGLAKQWIYAGSGLGWWIGAALLFANNSVNNLLLFALLILAFSVGPTLIDRSRRAQADAAARKI